METPRKGPILTVFEIHRATAAGIITNQIHEAQRGVAGARLTADLDYMQETPKGLLVAPVTIRLVAAGLQDSFRYRGIEAEVTSRDDSNPFSFKFNSKETEGGISYVVTRIQGPDINRSDPMRVDYSFREPLLVPRQITRDDLANPGDPHNLYLNENLTASILNAFGVPLLTPQDN
jgi:hypothetical protein